MIIAMREGKKKKKPAIFSQSFFQFIVIAL